MGFLASLSGLLGGAGANGGANGARPQDFCAAEVPEVRASETSPLVGGGGGARTKQASGRHPSSLSLSQTPHSL